MKFLQQRKVDIDKSILSKIFLIGLIFSIISYIYHFIIQDSLPEFFYCTEVLNNLKFLNTSFYYPESCDQVQYYYGFTDLRAIYDGTFIYQERFLFILFVFVVNLFLNTVLSLFGDFGNVVTPLSTFLSQIFIFSITCFYVIKIFIRENNIKLYSLLIICSVIFFNPMFKWGVFLPSHQTLTFLAYVVFVYFLINQAKFELKKISIIFGLLIFLHKEFIIAYFFIEFFNLIKSKNFFVKINERLPNFLIAITPYISYKLFFRFFNLDGFNANTEIYGQFIWLKDAIFGYNQYFSDWHCTTIPENFLCYFSDTLNMLYYMIVPVVVVIFSLFFVNKTIFKNFYFLELIYVALVFSLFWSLIGWYPPLRFNLYALGYLISILYLVFIFSNKDNIVKTILTLNYIFFFLSLNHWNDPNIITWNNLGYTSIVGVITLFLYILRKRINK
ncbi:hypothetical protein N9U94_02395 [Acidimicrobiaceae bacterium]|nr:hypothetical protein [Acidimicrobiaceae bacterium]